VKHIPNILSCFRIALSLALLILLRRPLPFAILYLLCGLSDVADGWLARRFHAGSILGAKLDSLGDDVFYGTAIAALVVWTDIAHNTPMLSAFVVVAAIRLVNFIITRFKFEQWGILHNIGNKAAGLLLFLTLPVGLLAGGFPLWLLLPLGIAALLSSLEETLIRLTSSNYKVNRKRAVTLT